MRRAVKCPRLQKVQNVKLLMFLTAAEGSSVKSKETVGNSWTVLNFEVILGHKYHHNR